MANIGQCVVIESIRADHHVKSRLIAMGLCPGVEVRLAGMSHQGPCILMVKDMRLALDWGIAHRIYVL